MREVNRLAEAAAVHLGVRDEEHHRHHREARKHHQRKDGGQLARNSRQQRRPADGLTKRYEISKYARRGSEEPQLEKGQVALDDESGADRVHQLQQTRNEKDDADNKGTNPSDDSHRQS